MIPGVLCNDTTLIISADNGAGSPRSPRSPHSASPASSSAAQVAEGEAKENKGDIELGKVEPPAAVESNNSAANNSAGYEVEGDPTERCILDLAVTLMGAPQATKQMLQRNLRIGEIPFDSATKYMATLHTLTPELATLILGKDHTLASTGKHNSNIIIITL